MQPTWTLPTQRCTHRPLASATRTSTRTFVDKSAVLVVRLAKNHPLPDGNKRAAWVTLRLFIEVNDWQWCDYPSVDEAEQAVLSIASGDWDQGRVAQ